MKILEQITNYLNGSPLVDSVVYGGISKIEGLVFNVVSADRNQDVFSFRCQVLKNYFEPALSESVKQQRITESLLIVESVIDDFDTWVSNNMNLVSFSAGELVERTNVVGYQFDFEVRKERKAPTSKRVAQEDSNVRTIDITAQFRWNVGSVASGFQIFDSSFQSLGTITGLTFDLSSLEAQTEAFLTAEGVIYSDVTVEGTVIDASDIDVTKWEISGIDVAYDFKYCFSPTIIWEEV